MHSYSKGETMIRRGAEGDSMFIVHDGSVAIRVDDHEVARLGPGSVVGEMALLTGETRTADVVAVTDVVAAEINKDALWPILHEHPELADAISAKVAMRRDSLDSLQTDARQEAEQTVLSRIRAYFGL
jgi:branched-chain amino acid transport system substrate-binding protein